MPGRVARRASPRESFVGAGEGGGTCRGGRYAPGRRRSARSRPHPQSAARRAALWTAERSKPICEPACRNGRTVTGGGTGSPVVGRRGELRRRRARLSRASKDCHGAIASAAERATSATAAARTKKTTRARRIAPLALAASRRFTPTRSRRVRPRAQACSSTPSDACDLRDLPGDRVGARLGLQPRRSACFGVNLLPAVSWRRSHRRTAMSRLSAVPIWRSALRRTGDERSHAAVDVAGGCRGSRARRSGASGRRTPSPAPLRRRCARSSSTRRSSLRPSAPSRRAPSARPTRSASRPSRLRRSCARRRRSRGPSRRGRSRREAPRRTRPCRHRRGRPSTPPVATNRASVPQMVGSSSAWKKFPGCREDLTVRQPQLERHRGLGVVGGARAGVHDHVVPGERRDAGDDAFLFLVGLVGPVERRLEASEKRTDLRTVVAPQVRVREPLLLRERVVALRAGLDPAELGDERLRAAHEVGLDARVVRGGGACVRPRRGGRGCRRERREKDDRDRKDRETNTVGHTPQRIAN